MKSKILNLVNSFWKFDSEQQPASSWNDKQDLLKEIEKYQIEELANVRNKLSPMSNLLAILESSSNDDKIIIKDSLYSLVISEIKKSKDVIEYISKKDLEK